MTREGKGVLRSDGGGGIYTETFDRTNRERIKTWVPEKPKNLSENIQRDGGRLKIRDPIPQGDGSNKAAWQA